MATGTDDEGRPPDGRRQYKSRRDQIAELAFHAIVTRVDDPDDPDAEGVSLELFIKEHPRGPDYVSDFIYSDPALPVTVCGVLLSSATGLVIGELELFRAQWGYFNDYDEYVGPDGDWRAKEDEDWDVSALSDSHPARLEFEGITGALLRAIPLGRILAWAHDAMATGDWRSQGLTMLSLTGETTIVPAPDLDEPTRAALERTAAVPNRRHGRPPLSDELLEEVARAYLDEAKRGRGLTRRLATRFGRPEETIRHWIHVCRGRGYLSPGVTGRRGAQPGERLLAMNEINSETEAGQ
jgi:hypothetical protein